MAYQHLPYALLRELVLDALANGMVWSTVDLVNHVKARGYPLSEDYARQSINKCMNRLEEAGVVEWAGFKRNSVPRYWKMKGRSDVRSEPRTPEPDAA